MISFFFRTVGGVFCSRHGLTWKVTESSTFLEVRSLQVWIEIAIFFLQLIAQPLLGRSWRSRHGRRLLNEESQDDDGDHDANENNGLLFAPTSSHHISSSCSQKKKGQKKKKLPLIAASSPLWSEESFANPVSLFVSRPLAADQQLDLSSAPAKRHSWLTNDWLRGADSALRGHSPNWI